MRRVVCQEFASLDHLTIVEEADVAPDGDQVAIAVRAAGVNFVDALLVTGKYQIKPPLPFTPGGEIAGDVVAVGPEVAGVAVGDRVFATTGLGGFTDRIVIPASLARPLPAGLSYGQGATLVQSFATAWFALTRRVAVQPGDWILVLGAGGGIGLATVDVARHLGARVIAAASSPDKLAMATAIGATATVNYVTEDLKARVRELAGGVDLVIDPVGGAVAEPALRTLRPFGRYLVVGFAAGAIPALPANLILLTNRAAIGVDWGAWAMQHRDENAALLDELMAVIAGGALHPAEPATMPLERAAAALADLQNRRIAGKLALTP